MAVSSDGRLIPRDVLTNSTRRANLADAMRYIVSTGAHTSSTSVHPVDRIHNPTSLNPAWRNADTSIALTWPWESNNKELMQEKVDLFANELSPLLTEVAPESGSYSNEADIFMKEWQKELYRVHWPDSLSVKEKYDPEGVFYSAHTPGADKWQVDENGRMCRTAE